ncbi:hypothetical protein BJ322DRAFT_850462 [Thelephora terrestris]|uniref:Uncharacterized protein n=1 Tax=Thelephora terrestris TaxID=56493 RepID=A0A9P6HCN7_9AGAM|nr:hypothetical protein BJ322DRAFT_850462 [Thelephora terrestris]
MAPGNRSLSKPAVIRIIRFPIQDTDWYPRSPGPEWPWRVIMSCWEIGSLTCRSIPRTRVAEYGLVPDDLLTAWKAVERKLPTIIDTVKWRACACDDGFGLIHLLVLGVIHSSWRRRCLLLLPPPQAHCGPPVPAILRARRSDFLAYLRPHCSDTGTREDYRVLAEEWMSKERRIHWVRFWYEAPRGAPIWYSTYTGLRYRWPFEISLDGPPEDLALNMMSVCARVIEAVG